MANDTKEERYGERTACRKRELTADWAANPPPVIIGIKINSHTDDSPFQFYISNYILPSRSLVSKLIISLLKKHGYSTMLFCQASTCMEAGQPICERCWSSPRIVFISSVVSLKSKISKLALICSGLMERGIVITFH